MGVRGDGAERGTGGCIERHHGDEGGVVFCFSRVWRKREISVFFAIG